MSRNLVLYDNITQCLTLEGVEKKKGRHPTVEDLGIIENAAIVADNDTNTIVWVGKSADLPEQYSDIMHTFSGEGEVWIPELVECHTHMIYGGNRHKDYALRCSGKTYQEIAHEGGGILSTIVWTREATDDELFDGASAELDRFQKYGVGTIEIKSGYGLSLESELRILTTIKALQSQSNVSLIPTFLPAHATPPEFRGKTDEYVSVICKEWIPEVARQKLAIFFDVFIDEGFFTVPQARKLCETAKEFGFGLKLHCDQFKDTGASVLGVELGAVSVDHLDNVSDESVKKIAASETVATMCPGASLFTGTKYAPARKLIDAGARVAVSTDYNPGTCPSRNLPLMTTIACSQMGLTLAEAITAVTYNAACALGLQNQLGTLTAGKPFRSCQLKASSYEVLPYSFGELE